MKRFLSVALAAGAGLVFAGSAFAITYGTPGTVEEGTYFAIKSSDTANVAAYQAGMAANGIQAARHNLGAMSTQYNTTGTSEICVFCHTPHHTLTANSRGINSGSNYANKSDYAPAPIWNRQSVATNFVAYGTTIGGSVVSSGQIGGVTLACLSCHDAQTTFDNLVNAPGSGLGGTFTTGTGSNYGTAARQGWTFFDQTAFQFDSNGGMMTNDTTDNDIRLNIGMGPTSGAVDLSNDHPMSICYSDGHQGDASAIGNNGLACNAGDTTKRASLRDRSDVIGDIDLATGLTTTNAALGTLGSAVAQELANNVSQNRWAVRGFISGGANDGVTNGAKIGDLLRNGKVECSSCHDPHFKNRSNIDWKDATGGGDVPTSDDVDGLFLRRVGGNAGSGVCRTCHNK